MEVSYTNIAKATLLVKQETKQKMEEAEKIGQTINMTSEQDVTINGHQTMIHTQR